MLQYLSTAKWFAFLYHAIFVIGIVAVVFFFFPHKVHQLSYLFSSSMLKWGHWHIYYYIVLQYTPSILMSFYAKKYTFKILESETEDKDEVSQATAKSVYSAEPVKINLMM